MPPKKWDDEEESSSGSSEPSPRVTALRRGKFEDEESDSDVLDSWDAAEDSEVEREKAKKAKEAEEKAKAAAAANKKSKAQRVKEHQEERARRLAGGEEESSDEETEAQKRQRMRRTEKDADLRHAEDLFGDLGVSATTRKGTTAGAAVPIDSKDPTKTIDLSSLALFNPNTKLQFEALRNTMVPIIGANAKKAHYALFLQEFVKQLSKDLHSDQIGKISSTLQTLRNEKMKEEKAADKTTKKSKAQKTKTTLAMSRPTTTDTNNYADEYGDDDFM